MTAVTNYLTHDCVVASRYGVLPRGVLPRLVVGYIVLLPFQFKIGASINFAPSDCFLIVSLLLGVGQFKYCRFAWGMFHLGVALVFALGSFIFALRYGSLATYELVNKDVGLFLPFLSYLACTSIVTEWQDVRRILQLLIVSVFVENLVAVAAYLAGYFFGASTSFVRYDGLRLSGMLLDPNAYGGLLAVALVSAEAASFGSSPLFGRPALLAIRASLALGLLFTFSRSAWIGIALALGFLGIVKSALFGRVAITALIGVPLIVVFMGGRFVPIVEEMARRPEQVQERFDLIQQAFEVFQRHPFLGGGLGSFRLTAGEIAHNTAMWFLADFGILGLGVLTGFLVWFFRKGWIAYQIAPEGERPIVLALLSAHIAMTGLAMGIEAFYQRHWWVILALIASSSWLSQRSRITPDQHWRTL